MKITIKNVDETFKVLENIDKEKAKKAIGIVTQVVYENTKTLAKPHIVTGTLEKNIRHKIESEAGIIWIDDNNMLVNWNGKRVNYANFVLYGTKPHKIEAKNKKALRFSYKNLDEFVFRKSVHHPGYRGDNFLKKAVEKTFSRLDVLLKNV
jgi:Fe-S cluster biosynthesis and repair protein YggX